MRNSSKMKVLLKVIYLLDLIFLDQTMKPIAEDEEMEDEESKD